MTESDNVPEELIDAHAEVSSDLLYYNYIEKGLLWSFALWRIQGMFESLVVFHYLPSKPAKPLVGLRSKLEAMSAVGYSTAAEHESELIAWGNLRNLLSHSPPEHYRPIAVDREDIEEYVRLLKAVCASWTEQRSLVYKK